MVLTPEQQQAEISRTRIPRGDELLGLVIERLAGGMMRVECDDGLTRICRIRGKIRKRQWIRAGDIILIKPWVVQENERADIYWRYTRTQALWLKRSGKMKKINYE